jgi:hypothetical protein
MSAIINTQSFLAEIAAPRNTGQGFLQRIIDKIVARREIEARKHLREHLAFMYGEDDLLSGSHLSKRIANDLPF